MLQNAAAVRSGTVERAGAQIRGDLVIIPEAGHEPQCRYPHTVNRMLDAFLARVWGSPQ